MLPGLFLLGAGLLAAISSGAVLSTGSSRMSAGFMPWRQARPDNCSNGVLFIGLRAMVGMDMGRACYCALSGAMMGNGALR